MQFLEHVKVGVVAAVVCVGGLYVRRWFESYEGWGWGWVYRGGWEWGCVYGGVLEVL